MNPTTTLKGESPPALTTAQARLAYLYKDLTRLSEIAAPDIILHPADRNLPLHHHPHPHLRPRPPLIGIAAAQQHEEELVALTCGTLSMDVESITVAKDQSFGCVMGVLKAGCCSPTPSFRRSTEDHSRAGSGAGASAESRREGTHRNDGGDDDDREDGGGRDGGGEDGGDRNKEDKHEVGSERRGKGPPRGRIEMPFCGVWRFDEMGRAVEHWENAASPETLVNWLRGK